MMTVFFGLACFIFGYALGQYRAAQDMDLRNQVLSEQVKYWRDHALRQRDQGSGNTPPPVPDTPPDTIWSGEIYDGTFQ
ncbi:MAG: hypothetical protein AB7G93_09595 [Bdellovibrionales bacterium]